MNESFLNAISTMDIRSFHYNTRSPSLHDVSNFPHPAISLLQQRCLVRVQSVNDIAQLINGGQSSVIRLISLRLVIDDQTACTLVQHANNYFVENHLRQFTLNLLRVEADHLGNVVDFDARKGFNHLDKVLLQHGVVEAAQVVADKGIAAEFVAVCGECAFVLLERTVAVCAGNGFHSFEVLAGVFDGLLRSHELVDIVNEIEHNLAEKHVLQRSLGFGALVQRVVSIEGFDKVRECGVEVLVFGVEHAALHVEVGL